MSVATANKAMLQAIYDAYGRGDPNALFDALDDSGFVMTEHSDSAATPWGGTWHGRKGMEDFIAKVTEHMTHKSYICDGMTDADDEVIVAWGHFDTCCNKSNNQSQRQWMHRIHFKDGKITSIDEFYDSLGLMEDLKGHTH